MSWIVAGSKEDDDSETLAEEGDEYIHKCLGMLTSTVFPVVIVCKLLADFETSVHPSCVLFTDTPSWM